MAAACTRSHRALALAALVALWTPLPAAPWIIFTEIHYQPGEGEALEFIEIFLLDPPSAALDGWRLEGDVKFRFPAGCAIAPGEFLVVARDPKALAERYPDAPRIIGPFEGALPDGGGSLELRNAAGARAASMRYDRGRAWPWSPAGAGHTLSLKDPLFDAERPESWEPSLEIGGTPGRANRGERGPRGEALVRAGDDWRFFRGAKSPPADWMQPGFDDGAWESGPGGFGFADGDDRTVIDGMQSRYVSLYTRRRFRIEAPDRRARILLLVDFDDGFAAYLNGKEVARANLGSPGAPVRHDAPASALREAGSAMEFDLGPAGDALRAGDNVLAVEVHNASLSSSDLSLRVDLERREPSTSLEPGAGPRINEAAAARPDAPSDDALAAGFIEIYNPGDEDFDLGGHCLSDEPGRLAKHVLPDGLRLAPRGYLVLTRRELGESFSIAPASMFLCLSTPGGRRVLDAVRLDLSRERPAAGRHPDGAGETAVFDAASPGAANRLDLRRDLVFNEIHYHPAVGDAGGEFIELFNRGESAMELAGLRLRGGVRFEFPAGAALGAGQYLVIAKEPEKLRDAHGLRPGAVLGPFAGALANGGEELRLVDAHGRTLERVEYADRAPWPEQADGWGSSLERIHPRLDAEVPRAWAASDEAGRSGWKPIRYRAPQRSFQGMAFGTFEFLLLEAGECLIDDLEIRLPDGRSLFRDGFDGAAGAWQGLGTHKRSAIEHDADRGVDRGVAAADPCLRLIADGRGNSRHNYVFRELPFEPEPGTEYEVSFRARWLRGSPLLLSRTAGQGLAKTHRLDRSPSPGSPGKANSRFEERPAPAIGAVEQRPAAPSPGEAVRIACRIASAGPLAAAALVYKAEGGSWRELALAPAAAAPAGETLYAAVVPGLAAGRVEFYIRARAEGGREATFPPGAPARSALYAVGLAPHGRFPTFTLLASDRQWQEVESQPRLSNHLAHGSLVYGGARIFHEVGFRHRGSPFTRSESNWRVELGADTLDGRHSLTFDGQGGGAANLNERLTYWLVEQLQAPSPRSRYVHLRMPGREESLYEDVEKVDRDFLERWFGGGEDDGPASRGIGPLHKVDDHWELLPGGWRGYWEADFRYRGADPEAYRWHFPPRANGDAEDFGPLLDLAGVLDPRRTDDSSFRGRVESLLEVDEWLRVLAARTLANDWDSIGLTRGKNAFIYRRPEDGRWRLLPWDADLSWGRNAHTGLFSSRFPSIQRLLSQPVYRRRFFGLIGYLAARKLDEAAFGETLEEFRDRTGYGVDYYTGFAASRRQHVLSQLPRSAFEIAELRREPRPEKPDELLVAGIAPPLIQRLRLGGQEGRIEFLDLKRFAARFEVGPEGGEGVLEGLDFGGGLVEARRIAVPPRSGAPPLAPPPPPAAPIEIVRRRGAEGEPAPASARESVSRPRSAIEPRSPAGASRSPKAASGQPPRARPNESPRERGGIAQRLVLVVPATLLVFGSAALVLSVSWLRRRLRNPAPRKYK
jgi:hypothetical protein